MSETPIVSQAPRIEYALNATTGEITRTDKDSTIVVATYKDGVVHIVKEWEKFRSSTIRWLNAEELEVKTILMEGDTPDEPKANIPKAPKMDPRFGDKTPAYVEWLRKYKPKEFRARYGIKGDGTVLKSRKVSDGNGGLTTETYEVHATLARRKIHLTEKVEAAVDSDDETEE